MANNEVLVFCGDGEGIKQPESFRCCPLGLQFYSKRELPAYEMMELSLRLPEAQKNGDRIDCAGVVVHSQFEQERSMYRVWVAFLDLPEDLRKNLHCLAESSDFLCPHCENF